MTPNKLPPLPETLEQLIDECRENAQIAGLATPEQRGWDHMADKLEALRQSQSMPAVAVAEVTRWNWSWKGHDVGQMCPSPDGGYVEYLDHINIVAALQADAREKGETDGSDGCTESNCDRCSTAPNARGDMRHAGIGSYPATQPAQASEKDNG